MRERFCVAWDRSGVRWCVGILLAAVVVAGLLAIRSRPVESVTKPSVVRSGSPMANSSVTGGAANPIPGSTSTTSGSPSPLSSPVGVVIVHVIGPVRNPGVFTLPAGSRVADAVAAAGGSTKRQIHINLARVLGDGEQIDVGAAEGPGPGAGVAGPSGGGGSGSSAPGAKVNLNKATSAQLEELPRVGPVLAAKIIDFRTQNGGFRSVDQLKEVPGVGDATFAQIAPHVQV